MIAEVLVLGAGVAGMAAALEAAAGGATVMIAEGGGSASERAQGGIAAALRPDDSPALHALDTLAAGDGLCDEQAVRDLTEAAPSAIAWLAELGVAFDPEPALEAAHSRPRVMHADGDRSGAVIVAALRRALDRAGVALVGGELDCLLSDASGVAGARLRTGRDLLEVQAGATVLATGGYAGLWRRHTTSPRCRGTGLIAALDAGARLVDLEFVQFHPTAFAGDPTFLVTEALRGAGARITDGHGNRFLLAADPRGELAPRAVVARAIAEHLARTGAPHVLLDARHLGKSRLEEFPGFLERCRRSGIDPVREPVPVAPAAHYTMGGIAAGLDGETDVPGLWAAGECARTGVHGANRLASNSLLEAVVVGRRAGRAASRSQRPIRPARPNRPCRDDPAQLDRARTLLEQVAGPLRDPDALARALREDDRPGELPALILRSALVREESRGAHVRSDRPDPDPAWATMEVAVTANGRVTVLPRPGSARHGHRDRGHQPPTPYRPARIPV
jgi:L-aspartate oxidase